MTAPEAAALAEALDTKVAVPEVDTTSGVEPERLVVVLEGRPGNRWYVLPPRFARMLGLVPVEGARHELRLAEGADPNALLLLPGGTTFTASELTTLRHKAYRDTPGRQQGWEVDAQDPGGY